MPSLTKNRAALIAVAVAIVVHLLALWNGWAGDDVVVVRDNPATQSIAAALGAWFEPYWPEGFRWAGLYRPFTLLTYGIDWQVSGGATWWFHLTNVLLHGLATALVVWTIARWLAPAGALAAGALFAVHAVHVEAVANVVGRAEILVAIGLLAAVLAARRYRHAATPLARSAWLAATLLAAVMAMASKEHGIIAVALIGLDQYLDREDRQSDSLGLYASVVAVTLGWLFVWRGIAGGYVGGSGHAALAYLTTLERWATMFPAYLDVMRLLAWPLRLASDYSPQVIPIREGFGWLAALGGASSLALLALGLASVKRAPPVAFGILVAAVSYLPTSNLLFVSGVVLGERNLYLAALAPAAALGWLVAATRGGRYARPGIIVAVVAVLIFAFRTVDRVPLWVDGQVLIAEAQTAHPENFQTRIVLARHLANLRDSSWALAEILVAGALLPTDPGAASLAIEHANAQGRRHLALREAKRAIDLLPTDPGSIERLAMAYYALGNTDSALSVAASGMAAARSSASLTKAYAALLAASGAPRWRRFLMEARRDWLNGELAAASLGLDSTSLALPAGLLSAEGCADVRRTLPVVEALNPGLAARLTDPTGVGASCEPE